MEFQNELTPELHRFLQDCTPTGEVALGMFPRGRLLRTFLVFLVAALRLEGIKKIQGQTATESRDRSRLYIPASVLL
jgi:hypothetical protein